jgi:hypothetical protein
MTLLPIDWPNIPRDIRPRLWPWLVLEDGVSTYWRADPTGQAFIRRDVAEAMAVDAPPWVSPRLCRYQRFLWLLPPGTIDATSAAWQEGSPRFLVPFMIDWCTAHFAARARRHPYNVRGIGNYAADNREEWLSGAVASYDGLVLDDAGIGRGSGEIGYRFSTMDKPVYWRDSRVGVSAYQGEGPDGGVGYRLVVDP